MAIDNDIICLGTWNWMKTACQKPACSPGFKTWVGQTSSLWTFDQSETRIKGLLIITQLSPSKKNDAFEDNCSAYTKYEGNYQAVDLNY